MKIFDYIFRGFGNSLGRILAYLVILVIGLLIFNKCDVYAYEFPDNDGIIGDIYYCTNPIVSGSNAEITPSCYSQEYFPHVHSITTRGFDKACTEKYYEHHAKQETDDKGTIINNTRIPIENWAYKEIYPSNYYLVNFKVSDFNNIEIKKGNWYVFDVYLTTFDSQNRVSIPSDKKLWKGGFVQYSYSSPAEYWSYGKNDWGSETSDIKKWWTNEYSENGVRYTHLYLMFQRNHDYNGAYKDYVSFYFMSTKDDINIMKYDFHSFSNENAASKFIDDQADWRANGDYRDETGDGTIYFDHFEEGVCEVTLPEDINNRAPKPWYEQVGDSIAHAFKNLFVPTEDMFNELIHDSQKLSDNFGFIGETVNFFIDLFTRVENTSRSRGCIRLPELTLKFGHIKGMKDFTLWSEVDYCVSDHGWFGKSAVVGTIRLVITMGAIIIFMRMALREFNFVLSKNNSQVASGVMTNVNDTVRSDSK